MDIGDDSTGFGTAAAQGLLTVLRFPAPTETRFALREQDDTTTQLTARDVGAAAELTLSRASRGVILRVRCEAAPTTVKRSGTALTLRRDRPALDAFAHELFDPATKGRWLKLAASGSQLAVRIEQCPPIGLGRFARTSVPWVSMGALAPGARHAPRKDGNKDGGFFWRRADPRGDPPRSFADEIARSSLPKPTGAIVQSTEHPDFSPENVPLLPSPVPDRGRRGRSRLRAARHARDVLAKASMHGQKPTHDGSLLRRMLLSARTARSVGTRFLVGSAVSHSELLAPGLVGLFAGLGLTIALGFLARRPPAVLWAGIRYELTADSSVLSVIHPGV